MIWAWEVLHILHSTHLHIQWKCWQACARLSSSRYQLQSPCIYGTSGDVILLFKTETEVKEADVTCQWQWRSLALCASRRWWFPALQRCGIISREKECLRGDIPRWGWWGWGGYRTLSGFAWIDVFSHKHCLRQWVLNKTRNLPCNIEDKLHHSHTTEVLYSSVLWVLRLQYNPVGVCLHGNIHLSYTKGFKA